jgi:outer membrane protein assembly factor BamE (lipoprotein component of BamABCDE complex)
MEHNVRLTGIAAILLTLFGCSVQKNYRGYPLDASVISQLKEGCTTQEEVLKLCGTPSCQLSFDPCTWYYLSEIIVKKGACKPAIEKILCYTFIFSPQGSLLKIYKSDKFCEIPIYSGKIPLPSHHRDSFLQQLMRNAGRPEEFFRIK